MPRSEKGVIMQGGFKKVVNTGSGNIIYEQPLCMCPQSGDPVFEAMQSQKRQRKPGTKTNERKLSRQSQTDTCTL